MMNILLSTAYAPPISWIKEFVKADQVLIEQYEHFPKQTYRNRCCIAGPNGKQDLIIPLAGRRDRTLTKDIRIDNTQHWQTLHWRSLEAAYRRSPFFEYYEDDLRPLYEEKQFGFLIDFNDEVLKFIMESIKISKVWARSQEYMKDPDGIIDLREVFIPNKNTDGYRFKKYTQVFEIRNGFIPDRSIYDLIFCEGPRAIDCV